MDMVHERDTSSEEEVMAGELRRGPWTVEEDLLLVNYVATHGEGRWNSLARSAGIGKLRINFYIIWSLVDDQTVRELLHINPCFLVSKRRLPRFHTAPGPGRTSL
jgi:hypothetical protein